MDELTAPLFTQFVQLYEPTVMHFIKVIMN